MRALGHHLLTEFYGCGHDILNDTGRIKNLMDEAAVRSGASIVESVFHRYNPHCHHLNYNRLTQIIQKVPDFHLYINTKCYHNHHLRNYLQNLVVLLYYRFRLENIL